MAEFPAMPLWTDAYLSDCGHLSDAEHGIYLQLLMALWRAPGQRLPNEDAWLARRFSRTLETIQATWRPIIREFCQCDGNWIRQGRVSREFRFVAKLRESRSESAKRREFQKKITTPVAHPHPHPHSLTTTESVAARETPAGRTMRQQLATLAQKKRAAH